MLDYASIAAVAAIIREGTFERGAASLGITPSAISQRVRGLEERLGAILIVRGQPCEPTELGRTLCAHLDRVRLLEHDLAPSLGTAAPVADAPITLRLAVNSDSLPTWFPAAIAAFDPGPNVTLDLTLDDEARTADRLRANEVLAAVTDDPEPVQGCKTIPLGALCYAACATPAFVERYFADGVTADSLALAPHIRFDRHDTMQARWAREAHGVDLTGPVHWVPSTHGLLDFILAGVGWGMKPVQLVTDHLASGRLVELPPALRLDVKLYWTVARLHAATLRHLTDAVCQAAARQLVQR
ncbi:LysR family transcriptional regulator ArgP (plasmid) [Sphingomonas aliaeris]|uniref:LysR family transcriptional regulator ArgP n=1 Tax=Sphingomonas aliaeris TaxID=2759526 RepID=A0A974NZ48_9SPHN|nr:LysR family transcriptional regulator ArgP [Sphingomonas aliaeris]QQV79490.1 LysR family transcriptional regulator ArgP [Sphingomonas aliaeris]